MYSNQVYELVLLQKQIQQSISIDFTMSELKNVLVIGHNGSGKSLLCATLVEDYKAFPISNDVERIYLQDDVKLIPKVKDSYKIFDWEGEPTAMEFQKLLGTFDEK